MLREIKKGFDYFVLGWHLLQQKGLKRFVVMPIVLNTLLLIGLFWFFLKQINVFSMWVVGLTPEWLDWLSYLIFIVSILAILLLFYYIFTTLAGFIAAPFNGLLAEKVEKMLTGEALDNGGLLDMTKDLPRILKREWQKLIYSLPRFILLFLLGFIPILGQTIFPALFFLFTAWLLAIQYCDYPFDNHKIPFANMKQHLSDKKWMNLTFGCLVAVCTFIPLLNFIVIPVAVCGATAMWVEEYRKEYNLLNEPKKKSANNQKLLR